MTIVSLSLFGIELDYVMPHDAILLQCLLHCVLVFVMRLLQAYTGRFTYPASSTQAVLDIAQSVTNSQGVTCMMTNNVFEAGGGWVLMGLCFVAAVMLQMVGFWCSVLCV